LVDRATRLLNRRDDSCASRAIRLTCFL
jgi:hypothetical protein